MKVVLSEPDTVNIYPANFPILLCEHITGLFYLYYVEPVHTLLYICIICILCIIMSAADCLKRNIV